MYMTERYLGRLLSYLGQTLSYQVSYAGIRLSIMDASPLVIPDNFSSVSIEKPLNRLANN